MLTHLLEVEKIRVLSFDDGGHATKGSSFQLFTSIKGVTILEKSCVVSRNTE